MAISGVSGIGGSYYTQQIASGKKINSAADDASGLAISEKLKSQAGAEEATAENEKSGINALNIADGALGGINDYLQRIKELSVKASNGLNTKEDKQAIQDEIDQYIQGIDQLAGAAEYNTMKLLDGNSMEIVTSPDGSGKDINSGAVTSEILGLKGYNVTGNFDMSVIDKAISTVSSQRSAAGASTNALEYAYNYSQNSIEQITSANSRIEDVDIAQAISNQKKENLMQQYRIMAQKKQSEQEGLVNRMLFGM